MSCNLCGAEIPASLPPRWRKDGFDVVACPSCGLVFRRDLPGPAELEAIYAPSYFRLSEGGDAQGYLDYVGDEDQHRLTARRRLDLIERRGADGRLLDVGAAAGFFVDEATARGWRAEGIDVAPAMTNWGRERLGAELRTGVFEHSSFPAGAFDCVTMWDYIEHSIDPAACFASAGDVLRPGGILALSTGDVASPTARVSGRRWHLLTPRHHNFYISRSTLRRYLDAAGFEVLEMRYRAAPYSLRYCVHKLGTLAPRSRILQAASDWTSRHRAGGISIPANLWDVLTVLARRH